MDREAIISALVEDYRDYLEELYDKDIELIVKNGELIRRENESKKSN